MNDVKIKGTDLDGNLLEVDVVPKSLIESLSKNFKQISKTKVNDVKRQAEIKKQIEINKKDGKTSDYTESLDQIKTPSKTTKNNSLDITKELEKFISKKTTKLIEDYWSKNNFDDEVLKLIKEAFKNKF